MSKLALNVPRLAVDVPKLAEELPTSPNPSMGHKLRLLVVHVLPQSNSHL
ncbi:hypothetical protein L1D54_16430 [Vibrio brasiliensis]|nr:hypothetical protein [Vibrio brasiliensis]MCG9752065.1 hypothetical protein [Vibrio brasiliensis]